MFSSVVGRYLPHTKSCFSCVPSLSLPPSFSLSSNRRRLEYMPLWKKSLGLIPAADTHDGDDGMGSHSPSSPPTAHPPPPPPPTSPPPSPRSGDGTNGGAEIGIDREDTNSDGLRKRSPSRSRSRSRSGTRCNSGGGAGQAPRGQDRALLLAARARLEELEEELSFEDIVIFRAMAEREEALSRGGARDRHGNGRGNNNGQGGGNRWGIGGWVRMERKRVGCGCHGGVARVGR